jgi:hypothetical protein
VIHHLVVLAIALGHGGHHHDGNGRHNRNVISDHSPTHNRGYQHTNNGNAGGSNPVQNALCRHVAVCNVSQKIIIVQPVPPAAPEPAPPLQAEPAPPVQVLPQTVVPQTFARPAARQPAKGPFMYMGPYGFMMMAPDSTGFGFGFG